MKLAVARALAGLLLAWPGMSVARTGGELVNSSPDGALLVWTDPEFRPVAENYVALKVVEAAGGRVAGRLPGAYRDNDHLAEQIAWHPRERVLALNIPDSRRFSHVELVRVAAGGIEELKLPDYGGELLKKLGAARFGNTNFAQLTGWHGNLLIFELTFNTADAAGNYQGVYSASVALRVEGDAVKIESIAWGR